MRARSRFYRSRSAFPSGSAGFTLVEVMVSAVVLGIGLIGLVNLHASAIRGLMRDEMLAVASDVARQRLELMSTMRPAEVPACAGDVGCRTPDRTDYLPVLPAAGDFECTKQVEGADVPRVSGAAEAPRYRVDMVVEPHPDPIRQPDGRLITVSVCWQDFAGIQELQMRRFIVGGD
jgi:prepilin-type N-terminal cleavage/methylation domain-containing protein